MNQPLPTNRSLGKVILLTIVTFGIYALVLMHQMINEINLTAAGDGKKTQGIIVMVLLTIVTAGIYGIIWEIGFLGRAEAEGQRRNAPDKIGFKEFLIFGVLLSWTIVGPIIYTSKLLKAFNAINASYNQYG
jgi:hypothetical protein